MVLLQTPSSHHLYLNLDFSGLGPTCISGCLPITPSSTESRTAEFPASELKLLSLLSPTLPLIYRTTAGKSKPNLLAAVCRSDLDQWQYMSQMTYLHVGFISAPPVLPLHRQLLYLMSTVCPFFCFSIFFENATNSNRHTYYKRDVG